MEKGLLLVLMYSELGPVYKNFHVAFKIFFVGGGECIVHNEEKSGWGMEEKILPLVGTQHWSDPYLFTVMSH